jgi:uncharacterized protein
MKRLHALVASAVCLMAAQPVMAQTAAISGYDKAPWWMKDSVITQTGSVYTEIQANRANFSATFLSVDDTAEKAQAKSIQQTRALQQALEKLGKDAVRVTTGFSMRPLYEQYRDKEGNRIENKRGDKIENYEVSLNLTLEVRDLSVLENAYALVLAAAPTRTANIRFTLQPSNETNTWLYNQAIKDARQRATDGVAAAGGKLGAIKVIDPTGRACKTDILARGADDTHSRDYANLADDDGRPAPPVIQPRITPKAEYTEPTAEALEAKALQNTFIQTPPLQRLTATACVVYGVE